MIWAILVFVLVAVVTSKVSGGIGFLGKIIVGAVFIFIGTKLWAAVAIAVIFGVIVGMIAGLMNK